MSESTFRCTDCKAEKCFNFNWADICNNKVDTKEMVCDCDKKLPYPVYKPVPPPRVEREPHPIEKTNFRIKDGTSWGIAQAGREKQAKSRQRSLDHGKKYGGYLKP